MATATSVRQRRDELLSPFESLRHSQDGLSRAVESFSSSGDDGGSLRAALASLDAASARWHASEEKKSLGDGSQGYGDFSSPCVNRRADAADKARLAASEALAPFGIRLSGSQLQSQSQEEPNHDIRPLALGEDERLKQGGLQDAQPRRKSAALTAQPRCQKRRGEISDPGEWAPLAAGPTLAEMRARAVRPSLNVQEENGALHHEAESSAAGAERLEKHTVAPSSLSIPLRNLADEPQRATEEHASSAPQLARRPATRDLSSERHARENQLASNDTNLQDLPASSLLSQANEPTLSWSQRRDRRIKRRRHLPPVTRRRAAQQLVSPQVSPLVRLQSTIDSPPVVSLIESSQEEPRNDAEAQTETTSKTALSTKEGGACPAISGDCTADITDFSFDDQELGSHDGRQDRAVARKRKRASKQAAALRRCLVMTWSDGESDKRRSAGPCPALDVPAESETEDEDDSVENTTAVTHTLPKPQAGDSLSSQTESEGSIGRGVQQTLSSERVPARQAVDGNDSATEDEEAASKVVETDRTGKSKAQPSPRRRRARRREDLF